MVRDERSGKARKHSEGVGADRSRSSPVADQNGKSMDPIVIIIVIIATPDDTTNRTSWIIIIIIIRARTIYVFLF